MLKGCKSKTTCSAVKPDIKPDSKPKTKKTNSKQKVPNGSRTHQQVTDSPQPDSTGMSHIVETGDILCVLNKFAEEMNNMSETMNKMREDLNCKIDKVAEEVERKLSHEC